MAFSNKRRDYYSFQASNLFSGNRSSSSDSASFQPSFGANVFGGFTKLFDGGSSQVVCGQASLMKTEIKEAKRKPSDRKKGTKRKTDETDMGPSSKFKRRNNDYQFQEALSEKSFADYSHKIGKEWRDVLVHLGTPNAKIEQYDLDYRYTHEKIRIGLSDWNTRAVLKTPVERFAELCKALYNCELHHVVDEIYAKYFTEPTSSPSSPDTMDMQTDEEKQEEGNNRNRFTITGKVIKPPNFKLKTNKSGKTYTSIVIGGVSGTNDKSRTIRNYRYRSTYVRHGFVYKFVNLIRKEGDYWIVRGSTIQQIATTDQEGYPRGTHRSLMAAMNTCQRSTIIGQIFEVSKVRMQKHGTLPVKTIGIEDEEDAAELILFGENAQKKYSVGMVIEATSVYGMLDGTEIRTTHSTDISIVNDAQ